MRILFVSNSGALSGAPRALLNLVRGLVARGHSAAVVVPTPSSPLEAELSKMGVKVFVPEKPYPLTIYPTAILPWKRLRQRKALKDALSETPAFIGRAIDEFKPDLVHTNAGPLDYAIGESHKREIPHIWHLREYQDLDFGMKIFPSKEVWFDHLYAPDNYAIAITADIFEHFGLRCRDRVIYDGVYSGEHSVEKAEKEDYFLYAARIEKAKGTADLLRAFRKFARRDSAFRLLVAGRPCGIYAAFWKAYAKIFIGRRVEFLGVRDDVPALMAKARAVVVPSGCEAFGFTTAEAMIAGTLVIGRDSGGTRDQLDRGYDLTGEEIGLRFRTVDELASRLSEAASGDFSGMTARARKVALENYSSERYCSEVENYYKRVLADEAKKPKYE